MHLDDRLRVISSAQETVVLQLFAVPRLSHLHRFEIEDFLASDCRRALLWKSVRHALQLRLLLVDVLVLLAAFLQDICCFRRRLEDFDALLACSDRVVRLRHRRCCR